MEATPPNWRISLKPGDTVSINATYDVQRGLLVRVDGHPAARLDAAPTTRPRKDPFDDAAEVKAMYDARRHPHPRPPARRTSTSKARKNLKLPDPRKLRSAGPVPAAGIDDPTASSYSTAASRSPAASRRRLMRPPVISPGETVTFTNQDALPAMPQTEQVWHSITSCQAPCNRGSGIGYPLANGPIKFDSGQLGYGTGTSTEVTTGSNAYTTPPLTATQGQAARPTRTSAGSTRSCAARSG